MTLPKIHRPSNPNGFEAFFKNTDLKANVGVWAIYVTHLDEPKSAAFIPKKMMALSVDRHRLKRRVLESLRPYSNDYSILVRLVKKTNSDVNLDDLNQKLADTVASLAVTTIEP